jgi:hypothetical protein
MRPTLSAIASVLLSAASFCPAAAQPPANSETFSPSVKVDAILPLAELLHAFGTRASAPGITAALINADGTLAAEAWGQARLESPGEPGAAMKAAARMMSGSVGKSYFAALVHAAGRGWRAWTSTPASSPCSGTVPWFASTPQRGRSHAPHASAAPVGHPRAHPHGGVPGGAASRTAEGLEARRTARVRLRETAAVPGGRRDGRTRTRTTSSPAWSSRRSRSVRCTTCSVSEFCARWA